MTAPVVHQFEVVNADQSVTEFVEVKTNDGATIVLQFQCADSSSASTLAATLLAAVDVKEVSLI